MKVICNQWIRGLWFLWLNPTLYSPECFKAFLLASANSYLSLPNIYHCKALCKDLNLKLFFIIVIGRTVRDIKMSQFFARDFTQDRWRKAALKNAYSLLGKQRFNHAAAFFLLAGSLWDAIQVLKTSSHFE